jgi:hypothetical protein
MKPIIGGPRFFLAAARSSTITAQTGGLDNASIAALDLRTQTSTVLIRGGLDDGHWLAYESDSSGQFEIWVRPFPSTSVSQYQISTSGGTRPVWAYNGKELFFIGVDGTLMGMPVEATATMWNAGAPTKLLESRYYTGAGNPNRSYDVSPDGQRFLMIKAASADSTTVPPNIIVVLHFDEELKRLAATK